MYIYINIYLILLNVYNEFASCKDDNFSEPVMEKALREYGYKNSHAFSHAGPLEGFPATRVRKRTEGNKAAMLLC